MQSTRTTDATNQHHRTVVSETVEKLEEEDDFGIQKLWSWLMALIYLSCRAKEKVAGHSFSKSVKYDITHLHRLIFGFFLLFTNLHFRHKIWLFQLGCVRLGSWSKHVHKACFLFSSKVDVISWPVTLLLCFREKNGFKHLLNARSCSCDRVIMSGIAIPCWLFVHIFS